MSYTVNAFDHREWEKQGLKDYGDFAEAISERNMGEDNFSGYGDWFYVDEDVTLCGDRVIYFGSWGNDNSPGASTYTNAELFDTANEEDMAEFRERVAEWENMPEYARSRL